MKTTFFIALGLIAVFLTRATAKEVDKGCLKSVVQKCDDVEPGDMDHFE